MSAAPSRLAAWLGVALTLGGCGRVGRSLVDHFDSSDAGPPLFTSCTAAPECGDAGPPSAEFAGRPLAAVDLRSCQACGDPAGPDPGPDGDAGTDDGPDCAGMPGMTAWQDLRDDAELTCTSRRVNLDTDPPVATLRLTGLRLQQVNLVFEASRPVELVLDGAHLDRVALSLDGPVALVVDAPRMLDDVQVSGSVRATAAPGLRIDQQSATALRVGGPAARFPGRVALTRVAVVDSQIVADEVDLESMTFYDGLIDARLLSTGDSDLDTVELHVGEGQVAAGRLTHLELASCGRLQLSGVDSVEGRYAPCTQGPLRLYGSSVIRGRFDGSIETDLTDYYGVRFGERERTDLTLWSGVLQASAFCAHARTALFGGGANCVTCEPEVFVEPGSLCNPKASVHYTGNYCEAFWEVPMCTSPPQRTRPPHGRKDEDRPPDPAASPAGPGVPEVP